MFNGVEPLAPSNMNILFFHFLIIERFVPPCLGLISL